MKNKISVTIICKNEENRIRKCLDSVSWADEIVVVDSGSTDKTLDVVAEYTDKIFINDWPGFGLQKAFAVNKASNDWVLSLDADEVVSEKLRHEIENMDSHLDEKTVYRINRLTHFCNKFIYHSGWHPDKIVRFKGAKKIDLKAKLFHYTFESLQEYIDKRNAYAKAWAKSQFAKGRKVNLFMIILHSSFAFFRHYILRLGVLDGYHGFLISVIQMQYTFNKYNFLKFMK